MKRKTYVFWLLGLPCLLLVVIFHYIPMGGIIMAFQEFDIDKGILRSPFIGFKNFEFFITSGAFARVLKNTLFLNFLFLTSGTIASVLLALSLNEIRNRFFAKLSQSLSFLPFFLSWAVVAMILDSIINYDIGALSSFLKSIGLPRIAFYTTAGVWPGLFTILRLWKGAGAGAIIYLAALTGIDPEIHEAAAIDGASRLQIIRYINTPLLKPTVIILTLMSIGGMMYGDLGMIYPIVRDQGMLFSTTDVIDTYVYRALRTMGTEYGMLTAVGLFQSLVGLVLVLGSNQLVRIYSAREGEDYALF